MMALKLSMQRQIGVQLKGLFLRGVDYHRGL